MAFIERFKVLKNREWLLIFQKLEMSDLLEGALELKGIDGKAPPGVEPVA